MNKYTVITFPELGISWDPARSFPVGSLSIHIYGVLIALGLMLAVVYAWRRCKQFGIQEDHLTDGVLWIVPFAIICARLYYCIFQWHEYAANPIEILYIWKGGLAIYGGVIGAVIGVCIHCAVKKIYIPALLDLVALGFLIGQCIGRWGNFFNREAFGIAPSEDFFLRMGLFNVVTRTAEYHHPTFLYESLWNLVGFIALHFLSKRRQYDGQIALGYVAWYGLGRALIEGLRTDSLYWGTFRVSQLLAALSCFAAVAVLLVMMLRKHDRQNLYVHVLARSQQIPESDEIAVDTPEEVETPEEENAPEENA